METAQIGDKARIEINDESRGWGYNPAPEGTIVELIGYDESYQGRRHLYKNKPGVYESHCWPKVRTPDGKEFVINSYYLKFFNNKKISLLDKFIRDLPETKFWEHDEIRFTRADQFVDFRKFRYIYTIDYNYIDKECDNGSPYPFYNITPDYRTGGCTTFARENDLELVARGNIWKYYHNEPMKFVDVWEEGEFFNLLGQTEEVANPLTNLYSWNRLEVILAVRSGLADCEAIWDGKFGAVGSLRVVRYHDRTLGEKLRSEYLKEVG